MATIKFSEEYAKLPKGIERANLVYASVIELEAQTPHFLDYDTYYPCGNYPLTSRGKYILLCFETQETTFFTTLRSYNPEKWDYYSKLVGTWLEVKIERGRYYAKKTD